VTYKSHLPHPPTLQLIKTLASLPTLPECVGYIGNDGWNEIKAMFLINRGRLSESTLDGDAHIFIVCVNRGADVGTWGVYCGWIGVQPVSEGAYEAVVKLGMNGGWDELVETKKGKRKGKGKVEEMVDGVGNGNGTEKTRKEVDGEGGVIEPGEEDAESSLSPLPVVARKPLKKRKPSGTAEDESVNVRRSKRGQKTT
jgi:hypothetical protein